MISEGVTRQIKFTHQRDIRLSISSKKMCLRLVSEDVDAHNKLLLQLFSIDHYDQCAILNFQTPFFKTSCVTIFFQIQLTINTQATDVLRLFAMMLHGTTQP